jgi:hypothetical protein
VCSHGPVRPDLTRAVARATQPAVDAAMRRAAMLSTGNFTVLHVSVEHPKSGIVAIETHGPLVD